MSHPPPHGLTEVDYEAIEAAVTETVRGRWFLNEFARRNRTAEMRLLMEAMARLETRIETRLDTQPALPSADPSVRMLIQRIKEIAGQLDGLSEDMREEGVEERFVASVALQARAVSGMMRGGPVPKAVAPPDAGALKRSELNLSEQPAPVRMPRADLPATFPAPVAGQPDPRLAALSGFDGLTLAKKLAVFS